MNREAPTIPARVGGGVVTAVAPKIAQTHQPARVALRTPAACVVNVDSVRALRQIPDATYDVTICDPPYTAIVHKNVKSVWFGEGEKPRKAYQDITFGTVDPQLYVRELLRVTKRWVICFCALEQFGDYQRAAGVEHYVRSAIYHKRNATPQITGDRPGQNCEGLAVMHRKGRKRWGGRGTHGFFSYARETLPDGETRINPTQKPVALMRELVTKFTEPGELVFDPFMGSGSTGVAALIEGRRFQGFEIDSGQADKAAARIATFLKKGSQ